MSNKRKDRDDGGRRAAAQVEADRKRRLFVVCSKKANKDLLLDHFEPFGTIEECTVVVDKSTGNSKGCAFVTFTLHADAKLAMQALDGADMYGLPIKVVTADQKDVALKHQHQAQPNVVSVEELQKENDSKAQAEGDDSESETEAEVLARKVRLHNAIEASLVEVTKHEQQLEDKIHSRNAGRVYNEDDYDY